MLCLCLVVGYRAWGAVSGSYRDQVVLNGVLSLTPRAFRIIAYEQCIGVLVTRGGEDGGKTEAPAFEGGGHINLSWQGRTVSVGGNVRLVSNFINQIAVISAAVSGPSITAQLTLLGSDKYRGDLTVTSNGAPPRSIPLVLPGPLTLSRRSDETFDLLAPIRSFRTPPPHHLRSLLSFEAGSCDPRGALDLARLVSELSLGDKHLPIPLPQLSP